MGRRIFIRCIPTFELEGELPRRCTKRAAQRLREGLFWDDKIKGPPAGGAGVVVKRLSIQRF
jgi:hypothetical protein